MDTLSQLKKKQSNISIATSELGTREKLLDRTAVSYTHLGYVGSSCVIKAKNNDLISMGVLHRIGKNFIDVSSSRNELPGIPYNLLIKLEIYNTQLGFKVL